MCFAGQPRDAHEAPCGFVENLWRTVFAEPDESDIGLLRTSDFRPLPRKFRAIIRLSHGPEREIPGLETTRHDRARWCDR